LSCGTGDTQLGPGGQHPAPSRTRWSKDDPAAAKPATRLQFALDFPRKESVCLAEDIASMSAAFASSD